MNNKSKEKKTAPPKAYEERYYLEGIDGHRGYPRDKISPRLLEGLVLLAPSPGEKILDIGCGKGEIVGECSKIGCFSVGIDYSLTAVRFSRIYHKLSRIVRASARKLPFRESVFDKVLLIDVVEHLDKDDLSMCLREIKRVLKTEGSLFIHTPNKNEHKLLRLMEVLDDLIFIRPFKSKYELHVNLQTSSSLQRILLDNGFKSRIWCKFSCYSEVKLRVFLCKMICRFFPKFLLRDIWCTGQSLKMH